MRSVLFALVCLFLSFFSLVTDPAFTFLLLDESAIPTTHQYLQYVLFSNSMPAVFNEDESSHMSDVFWIIRSSLIILVLLALTLWKKGLDLKSVKHGTLLLTGFLILCAIIPFDSFFTYFHYVFFPQGNWQFAANSTLITFYPASFFLNYAIAIALNSIAIALASFIILNIHHHNK